MEGLGEESNEEVNLGKGCRIGHAVLASLERMACPVKSAECHCRFRNLPGGRGSATLRASDPFFRWVDEYPNAKLNFQISTWLRLGK